jgi:hypothetical protein
MIARSLFLNSLFPSSLFPCSQGQACSFFPESQGFGEEREREGPQAHGAASYIIFTPSTTCYQTFTRFHNIVGVYAEVQRCVLCSTVYISLVAHHLSTEPKTPSKSLTAFEVIHSQAHVQTFSIIASHDSACTRPTTKEKKTNILWCCSRFGSTTV